VIILLAARVSLGAPSTQPAGPIAPLNESAFIADLKALAKPASRLVGSPGYYESAAYIESQLKAIPNIEWKKHAYSVMVPVTQSATLSMAGGAAPINVYPFWPAQVRLNATPAEGITGNLVYVGGQDYSNFKPKSLAGQIAVLEAKDAQAWTTASYFGARAVVILGSPDVTNADLRLMEVLLPINVPRFYLPQGASADAIRAGRMSAAVTLKASANWERKTAYNYYALVKGATARPADWDPSSNPPGALCITAPFDASGLVPDLAPGAGQAVQAAAALSMLRDFAAKPLPRPVLFAFTGGDTLNYRATREMFMALSDVPQLSVDLLAELAPLQSSATADLARLQAVAGNPALLDPVKDRGAIERVVKLIETDTIVDQDRLFKIRMAAGGALTPEIKAERETLEQRQLDLGTLRYSFQRSPKDLVGSLQGMAQTYVAKTIVLLAGDSLAGSAPTVGLIAQYADRQQQLQQRIDLYRWLAGALGRPLDPRERDSDARSIELMIAIDLADQGVRVGPMVYGVAFRTSSLGLVQNYRDWLIQLDRDSKSTDAAKRNPTQWLLDLKGRFDLAPMVEGRSPQSWAGASFTSPAELGSSWGVPAMSFITCDDLRLRRDTPSDTLANLNLEAITPQLVAAREMIARAWSDTAFHTPSDYRFQHNTVEGNIVSSAPGRPVPDLPRSGFVATYYYYVTNTKKKSPFRTLPWIAGVRRSEVADCDNLGHYQFEGLPKIWGDTSIVGIQVYEITPGSGAITSTTDFGKQTGEIKIYADLKTDLDPLRSVVFQCTEFSLVGLYDPRFLQGLGEVTALDARRNAEPQRYNLMLRDQMMAGFVEPDMTSALVFRYGRIGNRLLLLNLDDPNAASVGPSTGSDDEKLPRGYTPEQMGDLGPLALSTAQDFFRLDSQRLNDYRRAGVSNALIDSLHTGAGEQIDQAITALKADRGGDLVQHANGAWASETRVYSAAQDMATDVIRAAIFLLLLCVPFAFCMERLIIGTPNIYKQLGGLGAIFAIMTMALWSFHPAFKISASPLIIILAFIILFMSLAVIWVVYGKFDTEIKRIRSGRGSAEGASIASASVLMAAVLLGIANMRKRKFRTGLTSFTIVLITFAVLCFTSSSSFLDTTVLPTGVSPQYSGLMLRQRGFRPMPASTVQNLQVLLPSVKLVQRWWNVNATDPRDQIHVVAPKPTGPIVFPTQGVLGISPGESRLSNIARVIGKDKFARLESGEQRVIYFSSAIADQLKVKEHDVVKIGGIDVEVAGIFSADEFDQRVTTLSGEPIAPLKYSSGGLDASGRKLDNNDAESLDLDSDASSSELSGAYEHLSASQFVIVPSQIAQMLPNASLRSLAFDLPITPDTLATIPDAALRAIAKREHINGFETRSVNDLAADIAHKKATGLTDEPAVAEALVKASSDDLSKRLAVAMFAGFGDGVKLVSAGSGLPQVSGAGQVAVPLAIAGLIIFNTMMGSIAERRREIHIYTSLGLAPFHVGALFVAEAMTYGLIGVVFGYVIGQGVGTAMSKLGWLGSVTLNYSGTSAMITMGLILLIVLLSALVPARLASKIAAPSIERSWKVPLPKGDEILAVLPFTINQTAADGALAYLADFFDAHREGSIGKFSAGKVDAFVIPDDTGHSSRGLKTVVWLTPFDLGVRQHLMLLIHPGSFPDVYEVQVVLQRLSGADGNWYRMNRTFLTELRKQFLQWRSLSPAKQAEYVEQSKKLFVQPVTQVVPTEPGEQLRMA